MTRTLRVAGAQRQFLVGDIQGNTAKILESMEWAADRGADVIVFPELAVSGYPPEDLVLRDGFVDANLAAIDEIAAASGSTAVVVGFVDRLPEARKDDDALHREVVNAAAVIANGSVVDVYHKVLLPNYGVFDEARYFAEGQTPIHLHVVGGVLCGVSVCEDIWDDEGPPVGQAVGGAEVLLNINGSPYHVFKRAERTEMLRQRAIDGGTYVVYVNCVGGQDELVFDGGSTVIAPDGEVVVRCPGFIEDHFVVDLAIDTHTAPLLPEVLVTGATESKPDIDEPYVAPALEELAEIYAALVTGLRDYVVNNGFREVVIVFTLQHLHSIKHLSLIQES